MNLTLHRCVRHLFKQSQLGIVRQLCSLPPAKQDKYGGLTLDLGELASNNHCSKYPEQFDTQLKSKASSHVSCYMMSFVTPIFKVLCCDSSGWMSSWREASVKAAWLHVPLPLSSHMAVAAKYGFQFHHAEGDSATMCCWLKEDQLSALPRYATHQVGCSGKCEEKDEGGAIWKGERAGGITGIKYSS